MMALNSLSCADVPLSNYTLTTVVRLRCGDFVCRWWRQYRQFCDWYYVFRKQEASSWRFAWSRASSTSCTTTATESTCSAWSPADGRRISSRRTATMWCWPGSVLLSSAVLPTMTRYRHFPFSLMSTPILILVLLPVIHRG